MCYIKLITDKELGRMSDDEIIDAGKRAAEIARKRELYYKYSTFYDKYSNSDDKYSIPYSLPLR